MEWLVAKTVGYDLAETEETGGVSELRSMVAPVVMRCCLKHKKCNKKKNEKKNEQNQNTNLTVLCLPCFFPAARALIK